jgi:hypothetical protein
LRKTLLFATLGLAAMQSAATAQQVQNGVIRVTVREQGTSEPIAGVQVTLRGPIATAPSTPSPTVVTDQNGDATFEHLAPGRYGVQAQRDGYLGGLPALAAPTSFVPTITSSTLVISAQQSVQDVSLSLVRGATMGGRVRDAHGAPMPSARVYVDVLGYRDGRRSLLSGPSAQADSQGKSSPA